MAALLVCIDGGKEGVYGLVGQHRALVTRCIASFPRCSLLAREEDVVASWFDDGAHSAGEVSSGEVLLDGGEWERDGGPVIKQV